MSKFAPILIPFICCLTGCAFMAQKVTLRPNIEVAARPDLGEGRRVTIHAVDERSIRFLGYRGGVMKTGPITTKDDLAAVIEQALGDGLSKQGFQVVSSGETDWTIHLELRSLEYEFVQLPHSPGVVARAVIKVVASSGGRVHKQTYSKELLKPVHAAPLAGFNEDLINRTLAAILADILTDKELL